MTLIAACSSFWSHLEIFLGNNFLIFVESGIDPVTGIYFYALRSWVFCAIFLSFLSILLREGFKCIILTVNAKEKTDFSKNA